MNWTLLAFILIGPLMFLAVYSGQWISEGNSYCWITLVLGISLAALCLKELISYLRVMSVGSPL